MANIYEFGFKTIGGEAKTFADYKGRAVLVVNVASKCGLTPQYKGLEALHEKYAAKGLSVVGFPANEFGAQEPGSDAQISEFCTTNYGVKFDMMSKVVVKGAGIHPLFAYLTGKALGQVLRISRTQITDEGIEFGKRKRGANTLVTWTPALRAAVDECLALPAKITSMYLIFNADGQPYTPSGFKAMWQRMMGAWAEAGNERFTFHDLRAKAVTDTTEAGRKASDLTGHRTESVVAQVYDRRRVRKAPAAR